MNSPSKVAPGNTPSRCTYRKFDKKEKLRCRFCRGVNCIRCGKDAHKQCTKPAISMFHCNWISDSVMAMQRPSDELFDSIMLIEAFQCNGITAIINLCEPGEHPYCGYPIKSSGFPYTPERVMSAGIKYFNFYWQDMTAPSLSIAQNTIRVALTEILKGGKVAVHCHAGYGRTGIVVACLAVILQQLTAEEAVALVREKRPGSVQTSTQQNFVSLFHDAYHRQSGVYPLSEGVTGGTSVLKPLSVSMDDELLSPPLHLALPLNHPDSFFLLCKEDLPNAVRLSVLILLTLSRQFGNIGLSLSLARLAVSKVSVDRSVSISTILNSSLEHACSSPAECVSPIKGFLKGNKMFPNANGALVCIAPSDIVKVFKSNANAGKWKRWFSLPTASSTSDDIPTDGPEVLTGPLCDEDYDQQHIDVEKLLSALSPSGGGSDIGGGGEGRSANPPCTPVKKQASKDLLNCLQAAPVPDSEVNSASSDSITFMACHGTLLLDWFDSREDALFTPPLLHALRTLKLGGYGPYFFSKRGSVSTPEPAEPPPKVWGSSKSSAFSSVNALDIADQAALAVEEENNAASLDEVLRIHLSKRNLLLLEAVISVMSPLFEEVEEARQGNALSRDRSVSEISIFLVCAEMRVAFSMCQHFSKLPQLISKENNGIDREAIEDLFGKNFLHFDENHKPSTRSRTTSFGEPTVEDVGEKSFPSEADYESLDDLVNLVNALRYLCVQKWSALGDTFLACSATGLTGTPSPMQKSMLSTRQNNIHWNAEWLD